MGKSDHIVRHVCEDESNRTASKCLWHIDRNCFFMFNNFNSKRYHCIYSNCSRQWHPYGATTSCDLPQEIHDVIVLHSELGEDYVLPFAYAFKERSGYTIGVFQLREGLYGPMAITPQNLARVFYTMVVILCAVCKRLGGSAPIFKKVSFLYTQNHPVLTHVGAINSEKRSWLGHKETFRKKSWNRFLHNKTCKDVFGYLRHARPELFKKKCRIGQRCVLVETEKFDDETHRLVCGHRQSKLANVLKEFIHTVGTKGGKTNIHRLVQEWTKEQDSEK